MSGRMELVSQWQERLASAEQLAAGTARFRWMHLARVRLYRFLLACYGSGQWREGNRDEAPSALSTAQLELPQGGKPPKSIGTIRSVLKAVHTARDNPPPIGPLTGGLDPEAYVAVTDSDANIDVERCETLLRQNDFHVRVVGRGRRFTVEVPYWQLREAESLVEAHRISLRPPRRTSAMGQLLQRPPLPEETQTMIVGLVLIAPVMGMAALVVAAILVGEPIGSIGPQGAVGIFLPVFLVVAEISLLWYFFAPRWQTRLSLAARRRIAMAVFWLCVGVPAAFVIAAAIRALPGGPLVQSLSSPAAILAIVFTIIGFIAISFDWCLRR